MTRNELCLICKDPQEKCCLDEETRNIYNKSIDELKILEPNGLSDEQKTALCLFFSKIDEVVKLYALKFHKMPSEEYLKLYQELETHTDNFSKENLLELCENYIKNKYNNNLGLKYEKEFNFLLRLIKWIPTTKNKRNYIKSKYRGEAPIRKIISDLKTILYFNDNKQVLKVDYAIQKFKELYLAKNSIDSESDIADNITTAESTEIDWKKICGKDLEKHKLRQQATEESYELEIFVPLMLMKREKQQRRSLNQNIASEDVYSLEEKAGISHKFDHEQFLKHIGLGKKQTDKQQKIAIIGEPGAGKTTLLEKIAQVIHEQNKGFAISISLASLEVGKTLHDYLEQKWLKDVLYLGEVPENYKRKLAELFRNGNVWLLLDGLDEMKTTSPVEALKTIEQFIKDGYLAKANVILSCRLNVWDANSTNLLNEFDTYKTINFEASEQDQFIQEWFTKKGKPSLGKKLSKKLKESGKEQLCALVKNPLRLVLLCRIWASNLGELPETKALLYQRYLFYFYEWKKEIIVPHELQEKLHQALGKLAKAGFEMGFRYRLPEKLARKEMGNERFQLASKLGWLNIVYRDQKTDEAVYAFFHPTFQEYFAACAVEDWDFFLPRNHVDRPVEGKQYLIFEANWKEVILLWLGREDIEKEEKEAFIKALVEFKDGCGEWNLQGLDRGFYEYQAYCLAATAIAEFKDYSKADEIVKGIIKYGFGYFERDRKKWITFPASLTATIRAILASTERIKIINSLIELSLNSPNEDIRRLAAISLAEIAPSNDIALNTFIQLSLNSENKYICCVAIMNLGKIGLGNDKAITALIDLCLNSSLDKDIRRLAIMNLGEIGLDNDKALNTLRQLLCQQYQNEDFSNCWANANNLGKIGQRTPKNIAALIELCLIFLKKYFELEYRPWQDGKKDALDLITSEVIAALIQLCLTAHNKYIHWQKANNLEEITQDILEDIAALIQSCLIAQNEFIRWEDSMRLGKIGPSNLKAVQALILLCLNVLKKYIDWEDSMRSGKNLCKPDAIKALSKLCAKNVGNRDTQRLAAITLAEINTDNTLSRNTLIELLEYSARPEDIYLAVIGLGEMRQANDKVIDTLLKLLEDKKDENKYICGLVAMSLGKMGRDNENDKDKAITALIKLIKNNKNDYIRWIAVNSLGKIGQSNEKAIAILNKLINDKNDYICWAAVNSLRKIDPSNSTATKALIYLVQNSLEKMNFSHFQGFEGVAFRHLFKSKYKLLRGQTTKISETIAPYPDFIQLCIIAQTDEYLISDEIAKNLAHIDDEYILEIVTILKQELFNETRKNNPERYDTCYGVIHNYAQNLLYQKFYQIWHA